MADAPDAGLATPRPEERHFAELFQFVDLASVMLDRDGNITYCNNVFLQLTGWTLPEVLGRNWFDTFVPAQRGQRRPDFGRLLDQSPDTWRRENVIETRAGTPIGMRWHNALRRARDGRIVGSASIGEDITERKAAAEAMAERAAELERFHRLSVARELQMVELKKRLNESAALAGEPPPFPLSAAPAAIEAPERAAGGQAADQASFQPDAAPVEARVRARSRIRWKLSAAFVSLAALVGLFMAGMVLVHRHTIDEAAKVQASLLAQLMAESAIDASGFRPDLPALLAQRPLFAGRDYAIVDASEVTLAAGDAARVGTRLDGEVLRQTLRDGVVRTYEERGAPHRATRRYLAAPVRVGDAVIGAVSLEYSPLRAALAEADEDELRLIAGAGAVLVLLLLGFGLAAARRVAGPIDELMRGVSRVASGDFSARVPVATDDELGQLAAGFNRMSALIGSSHGELSEFNSRLDRRVQERTRELEEASRASLNMMEDAIREREAAEKAVAELDYLASFDALTGLANRHQFLGRTRAWLEAASGSPARPAVALLDVERFHNFNDSQGQLAGDELLRQLARWLEGNLGDSTRLARIGADLFAIGWSAPADAEAVLAEARAISAALLEQPFPIGGAVFRIAARLGVALQPDEGVDAETLFQHAESALKAAKSDGERVLPYDRAMSERIAGKPTMESRLRRALEREEFVLYYQPKFDPRGRLSGAEALIRWQDPQSGLVPPGSFIPLLEETGLISDVGEWALRQAAREFLRWTDAGFVVPRIAVNVSPLQLRSKAFIAQIRDVIALDQRAVDGIELEITESMIMANVQQGIASLEEIRALGLTIALDDFGTGFSSLGYLSKLPVDSLKVDRSFIVNMTTGPEGMSLVSLIINLAHSLRLKVVAEGIETEEQAGLLKLLRCDEFQGYLFGKPVDAGSFEGSYLAPQRLGA
jgi:diguanylate cyclase (GGDEF)-like protein/PAS domain S-box-containing protein